MVHSATIKSKLRLIDCVGYMIPGAIGNMEGEVPRLVSTLER